MGATTTRAARWTGGVLVLAVLGTAPHAEDAPALAREHKAELIRDLSASLNETYVFPDVAEEMVALINSELEQGAYDALDSVADLAARLTQDLQSISHDKHLNVRPFTPPAGASGEPPDPEEQRRLRMEAARRDNFGFHRLEILPGNVGYLDLRGFMDAGIAGPTAIAAMNFLANSSALIIDLRFNGGGSPSMIQLISSYLFDEPQHLNSFYIRRTDSTRQFWTQANVVGPKLVDVPVFVLTSGRTFSAAEEFTYNLKNMERATIVGETTGGGAHPVEGLISDMGDGFYARASIPFGRAVNPITGTNWEGTGVTPHVEIVADQAFERAQIEALALLTETTDDPGERLALEWAREGIEARLAPVTLSEVELEAYVGSYGPRRIIREGARLVYQRDDGPRYVLVPMGGDRFGIEQLDNFRIRFERNAAGRVVGLTGQYADGRTDRHDRV